MTFGVTAAGFVRKTLNDILSEIKSDQLADMDPDLDVADESLLGQLNAIHARQLSLAWEALEACYLGFDPEAAEGRLLESICKITGTFRPAGVASEVDLQCDVDAATVLVAGEAFAAIDVQPDVRWTPKVTFTSPSDGVHTVRFVSERTGPVSAAAGSITVIATPVVGWNSVNNGLDATPGSNVENDEELRLRREVELATTGSTTVRAIASDLLQAFPAGIQNLDVFENDTDETDGDGRPPHTVEALIYDGDPSTLDDDEVAGIIFEAKAGGVGTYGTETGTVAIVVNGVTSTREVMFSRPAILTTYLTLTLATGQGYVGDAAVKAYVASECNKRFGPGKDVIKSVVQSMPLALAGVEDVTAITLGFAPAPVGTSNLAVGVREIARFDTTRIAVTVV